MKPEKNYLLAFSVSIALLAILCGGIVSAEEKIPYWGLTHTADYADLAGGVSTELNVLQRVQFQINGKYAHVGVVNLDQAKGTAGIEVVEPVQRAVLAVGTPREFDITGDDMSDISVKLSGISNNLANRTITSIPLGQSKNVSSLKDSSAPLTSEGFFLPFWVILVIILIVVLIAAGFFILKRKKS